MNFDFYSMIPGAIDVVEYKYEVDIDIPQSQKESFIDNSTREAMHAIIHQSVLNPGESVNPAVEFEKARNTAKEQLENMGMNIHSKFAELQIGNEECLNFVLDMEKDPKFKGWVNQPLINAFILETKSIIAENSKNK